MKNIPIVILNKDRLESTKKLVASLKNRNYDNITILDNASTYQPLLDWYENCDVAVFYNKTENTCTGAFYYLAFKHNIKYFQDIINNGHYIYTDSDIVPIDETPVDFIEDMIEISNRYQIHKIGMGIKIDDLPDCFYKKNDVVKHESLMWGHYGIVEGEKMPIYKAAIDTTFAVYKPRMLPILASQDVCLRTGFPYLIKHWPWYYDYNHLPPDEEYYIKKLEQNKGPHWSFLAKEVVK